MSFCNPIQGRIFQYGTRCTNKKRMSVFTLMADDLGHQQLMSAQGGQIWYNSLIGNPKGDRAKVD